MDPKSKSYQVTIGGRKIGPAHPPFIIAELSGNHNGSLETALQMVDEAYKAGAHALKLQTYTADTLTIDYDKDEFLNAFPKNKTLTLFLRRYTFYIFHYAILITRLVTF